MTPAERAQRIDLLLIGASLLIALASSSAARLQRDLNELATRREPPEPIPMPAAAS